MEVVEGFLKSLIHLFIFEVLFFYPLPPLLHLRIPRTHHLLQVIQHPVLSLLAANALCVMVRGRCLVATGSLIA